MTARDRAYLDLLHHGLVMVRESAYRGDVDLCRIEADHIHNLPILLNEDNAHSHRHYLSAERSLYLQRLREAGATDYLEWISYWVAGPWRALATAAGLTLAAWDDEVPRS